MCEDNLYLRGADTVGADERKGERQLPFKRVLLGSLEVLLRRREYGMMTVQVGGENVHPNDRIRRSAPRLSTPNPRPEVAPEFLRNCSTHAFPNSLQTVRYNLVDCGIVSSDLGSC
jgi:hypothetical protein